MGWVNERFLVREDDVQVQVQSQGAAPPTPLLCLGTEPFWRLDLNSDGTARCSKMGEEPLALETAAYASDPAQRSQTLDVRSPNGQTFLHVQLRRTDQCSDGMSDLTYPFAIDARGPGGELHGCCRPAPAK